jgi:hypothetical protein
MTNTKQCKSNEMLTRTKLVSDLRSSTAMDKLPQTTTGIYDKFPDFRSCSSGFIDMKVHSSIKPLN